MSIGMSGKTTGDRPSSRQRGDGQRGTGGRSSAPRSSAPRGGRAGSTSANRKPKTKAEAVDFDEDEDDEVELDSTMKKGGGGKTDIKVVILAVIGVAVLVVVCMIFLKKDDSAPVTEQPATLDSMQDMIDDTVEDVQPEIITDTEGNPVYDSSGNVIGDDAINPGYVTELDNMSDGSVPAQVFDADDYISDLNGVPISGKYNVESIDYVADYVSYEIKRAVIDSGMEMYWAEIEYEGKKYRAQMSYSDASKFKDKGIARAQLEVLNVVGGGKVISYIYMETE